MHIKFSKTSLFIKVILKLQNIIIPQGFWFAQRSWGRLTFTPFQTQLTWQRVRTELRNLNFDISCMPFFNSKTLPSIWNQRLLNFRAVDQSTLRGKQCATGFTWLLKVTQLVLHAFLVYHVVRQSNVFNCS